MRFREIRVIASDGSQLGIMQSRAALAQAQEEGLDLVMIAPNAQPPVCRIVDFGKHKYMTEKQNKDKKSKQQDVKGIKISPRIADHDIQIAVKKAFQFLEAGHKVRFLCQFRAREVTRPELGKAKLDRIAELVSEVAQLERAPSMEGRQMSMVVYPKEKKGQKNAKAENKQNGGQEIQSDGERQDHPAEISQQPPVPTQERSPEATS